MSDDIRWFDSKKTIGLLLGREDGSMVLKRGSTEHVLSCAERKVLLRALRRMRDYEEGMRRAIERDKP